MLSAFDRDTFAKDTLLAPDPHALEDLRDLLAMFASFRLGYYDKVDSAQRWSRSLRGPRRSNSPWSSSGHANAGAHLNQLRNDFGALLYRNGQPFTWEKFVDSYVQIAAFGARLWHLKSGQDISLSYQVGLRPGVHPLLAVITTSSRAWAEVPLALWDSAIRLPRPPEPAACVLCRAAVSVPLCRLR